MADSLISARVPRAKRDAAAGILEALGSNTTELVNRAFDYVLAEKKLPELAAHDRTDDRAADFFAFVNKSTMEVAWDALGAHESYKTLLRKGKQADYERLA